MSFVTLCERTCSLHRGTHLQKIARRLHLMPFGSTMQCALLSAKHIAQFQARAFCNQHGRRLHTSVTYERMFHKVLQKYVGNTSIRTSKRALSAIMHLNKGYRDSTRRSFSTASGPPHSCPRTLDSEEGVSFYKFCHAHADPLASPATRASKCLIDRPAKSQTMQSICDAPLDCVMLRTLGLDLCQCRSSVYFAPTTPSDKILHTPASPPSISRPTVKHYSTLAAINSLESAAISPSQSLYFISGRAISKVSDNIRRRLSVVAPPEAVPVHAPRRLSYSHTYTKPRSPLARRISSTSSDLTSYAETELLASPVTIVPSSSRKQSISWADGSSHMSDLCHPSMASPWMLKV